MSKSIKLKDNVYIDSKGITHNRELLSVLLPIIQEQLRFKKYDITFDVSNKNVGDFIVGHTNNVIPSINGYTVIGFCVIGVSYGDVNFITSSHIRNNYIYALLRLGYRGTDTTIGMSGYVIYAKNVLIDSTPLS